MTRRTFNVIDIVEILVHWHAGRKKAEVARSLGVDRGTVAKYTAKAEAEGYEPGGEALSAEQWAALVRGWFPELVDPRRRSLTHDTIDAHRADIESMLKTNTATTVHQRLRDEAGLEVGLTSFRRYVWREFPEDNLRNIATPPRPDVEPGSEAQIDYGYLGTWLDPMAERLRRVWAFVMVLACSRHMFVRPVLIMDQRAWTQCHIEAFAFFGAVPRRLVSDNLKTGVIKPDIYDPLLNRSYAELAAHYHCLIDPARALKPKDKPRVERAMPYVRDSLWRGRDWLGVPDMCTGAVTWCKGVAGVRSHRSLDGASPLSVFEAVELPAMMALPAATFELASWSRPKVGPDCYAKAGKALYTIPWRFIGQRLDARDGDRTVEFYADGKVIKTWARIEKGKQTDWADFPPEKVAFFMSTPQWCLKRATDLGEHVLALVAALLEVNALYRLRQAQGVVGLAEKNGADRLDAACRRAIEIGDPEYRTVKGILKAGTENDGALEEQPPPDAPAHLHGPAGLFDHLAVEVAQ
ncbi:MAG TPA: IS21 family transposase [Acidimicrobiales bacterium]|nr:IS21 family transposase [Acidimicrobiales bacterium]